MKLCWRRTIVMARLILFGVAFTSTGRFVAPIAVKRKSGPGPNRNGGTKSTKDLSIPRRVVGASAGGRSGDVARSHGGGGFREVVEANVEVEQDVESHDAPP